MTFNLDTNLAELPLVLLHQLSSSLGQNGIWMKVLDSDKNNAFYSSPEEIEKINRQSEPAQAILQRWGNRGQTIKTLIFRLQWLSIMQGFGTAFDHPQLVLKRKFKGVRWVEKDPKKIIKISVNHELQEITVEVQAVGFPAAQFEWRRDGEPVGIVGSTLRLTKCRCESLVSYVCRVWNEVEDGHSFSDFYRNEVGKEFSSEIFSEPADLTTAIADAHACNRCKAAELEKIREKLGGTSTVDEGGGEKPFSEQVTTACEQLVAADKVALIISNCAYQHLPSLITPHCDAEALAQSLQELNFKTVTLADLTLSEMRFMIGEYKKLLGNDVYAVLYFAGHGFEVNGQCYLLPVEAPLEAHAPEHSLSMDWVLASLVNCSPALHLILLDVCRKYIPIENVSLFIKDAERLKGSHHPNRNTVFGYSTSGGVGAYEVKGEVNGVFMKYLRGHIGARVPVVDMLQRVFVDIESDSRVQRVQIPELRTTITKPRSLSDDLVCDGHTASFDQHNVHWTLMHELPMPVYVRFDEQQLMVTIWFDYCGHFTNKVYAFSSVERLQNTGDEEDGGEKTREGGERAKDHLAYLKFPPELETSGSRSLADDEEGVSVSVLLSHLQRNMGPLSCTVELTNSRTQEVVAKREAHLGHVLITKIQSTLRM